MTRLDAVDGGIRMADLQSVPLPVEAGKKVNIAVADTAATVAVESWDGESTADDEDDKQAEEVVAFVDDLSNYHNRHH